MEENTKGRHNQLHGAKYTAKRRCQGVKGLRPGLRQCLHSSEPQFINQQDSSPGVPSQLQNSRLTMGYLLLLPNEQN